LHCFGHIHEAYGAERITWSGILPDYDDEESIHSRQAVEPSAQSYVNVSNSALHPLQYGSETLMINASTMDHDNQPIQAPWIVDLELPIIR
jgi:hypothetical protein